MLKLSPSAVAKYRSCQRLYAFEYNQGFKPPTSPKQQFGKDVHAYLEKWLRENGKDEYANSIQKISKLANFIYIRQKGPYGNGTPVLNARPAIGNEPFAVVWGDDIWNCPKVPQIGQLMEAFKKYETPIITALKTNDEGTKKYGIIDGEKIESSVTEIKSKIVSLLGYPLEFVKKNNILFRYTVFTPQENMRQIIYDDKEIRLNTLRKVFNIDKYKKIKENAQFIAKELRSKKRALEETITDIPTREIEKQKVVQEKEKKEQDDSPE